jgi:hypothetical protein
MLEPAKSIYAVLFLELEGRNKIVVPREMDKL